jgi:anti-anti-sigma factor
MLEPETVSIQPHAEAVWAILHQSKLDDTVLEEMQREVPAAAGQRPGLPVVLDMSEVRFVPSVALGALVLLMRNLKRDGHRLLVVGLQPEVRNVLAMTRIDKLLELRDNFEEALNHLRSAP